MASIPLFKDFMSASTPIQQHYGSGLGRSCKRFLNSPAKEIDLLSPIQKTTPFRCNLLDNLNALDNCDVPYIITVRQKQMMGVSRKLKFTELSNLIDVSNAGGFDNDSGIESDRNLSTSEDQDVYKRLIPFPTDENCNIISTYHTINDNSSFLSSKYIAKIHDSGVEYNELEDKSFGVLDNRINITNILNEKKTQNDTSNLDILSELNLRNCSAVLSLILSYLPNEDLQKAGCVNKEWREIVSDDTKANARRKAYIKERREILTGPRKENKFRSKSAIERNHKPALFSVINYETEVTKQPLNYTQTVGRFDSFIKQVENLRNEERLIKCPKCRYPSRAQAGNKFCCTRSLCQHEFCKICLGPYLDNHSCCLPELNATLPRFTIGSKQSRKNLRRL